MSLMVQLPLNGNLNNQGLSDVNITSSNISYVNGKMGLAANFSNSYIGISNSPLSNTTTDFSFAFWLKVTTSSTACLQNGRTATGGPISIFIIGGVFRVDDGAQHTSTVSIPLNSWHHYAITRNPSKIIIYVDGVKTQEIGSTNFSSGVPSNATIGASSTGTTTGSGNYLSGLLNDYRVYDHCLSEKEIKEISKGLVLHYPLKGGNSGGNENLLKGSDIIYTASAKKSYTLSDNFRSDIKNILLKSKQENKGFTLSYDIELNNFYFDPNATYTRAGVYWGVTITHISNGNKVTQYGNHSGPNTPTIKHNYFSTNSLNGINNTYTASNPNNNFKGHYSCTVYPYNNTNAVMQDFFINPNNYTISTPYLNVEISGANVSPDSYIKNVKLEYGNEETSLRLSSYDASYSSLEINNNIEYDCSGFGNHGEKIGNIVTKSESARMAFCENFNELDKITFPDIPLDSFKEGSIGFQLNIHSYAHQTHYLHFSNAFNQTGNGHDAIIVANTSQSNGTSVTLDCCSYTSNFAAPLNSQHHYVITQDKNYKIKKYVDGVLKTTHDDSVNKRLDTYMTKRNIRGIGNVYNNSTSYDGDFDMSDFRIYATALSADDILELYEVGLSIAKGDSLQSYEYMEDNNLLINKNNLKINSLTEDEDIVKFTEEGEVYSRSFYEI